MRDENRRSETKYHSFQGSKSSYSLNKANSNIYLKIVDNLGAEKYWLVPSKRRSLLQPSVNLSKTYSQASIGSVPLVAFQTYTVTLKTYSSSNTPISKA